MRTLDDLDVDGKRVLVRVDFNVPLRRRRGSPTTRASARRCRRIERLRERGARLLLPSHLGRPEGPRPGALAAPGGRAAGRAARAPTWRSPTDLDHVPDGDVVHAREHPLPAGGDEERPGARRSGWRRWPTPTSTTPSASAHRAHASTEGVAHLLPSAAGPAAASARSSTLTGILEDPARPLVAIVGGAKVTDKIGVLEAFLRARRRDPHRRRDGLPVPVGPGALDRRLAVRRGGPRARRASCSTRGARQAAPAGRPRPRRGFDADTERRDLDGVDVPDGWMGLDIGPRTAARLRRGDRRRRHRVLERPDGRVRARALRGRHARGRRGRGRRARARRSSAAATPPRRCASSAWPTASPTCRPAAARRSSSSRARRSPEWRSSRRCPARRSSPATGR